MELTVKLIGEFFENTTPEQMLCFQDGGHGIRTEDMEIIRSLRASSGFSDPILNVLLQYVLIKYGKIKKHYVEEIAVQWSKSQIKSVHEAMCIIDDDTKQLFLEHYGISKENARLLI